MFFWFASNKWIAFGLEDKCCQSILSLFDSNKEIAFGLPFSKNPAIFQCDYTFYRERMDVHREELIKAVFHPKRLKRSLELGYDLFDELE